MMNRQEWWNLRFDQSVMEAVEMMHVARRTALLTILMAFATGKAHGSSPTAVEIICPVCQGPFIMTGVAQTREITVHTCPWCLFSAPGPELGNLHADDVEPVQQALNSAADTLPRWAKECFGVEIAFLDTEVQWEYHLMRLLAIICADARRDVSVDSVRMQRVLSYAHFENESIPTYLNRRLLAALEREIDDRIELSSTLHLEGEEREAFQERMQIERLREVARLHLQFGSTETAIGELRQVIQEVEEWNARHLWRGFRWGNQVGMVATDAQRLLDHADIQSWPVSRLEETANLHDCNARQWANENVRALDALAELDRRDSAEADDALARFTMQSVEHLRMSKQFGILELSKVRERPQLLQHLRQVAAAVPDLDSLGDRNDKFKWSSVQDLTQPFLSDELIQKYDSSKEILHLLEVQSLRSALNEPLYRTVVVTEQELARDTPFGIQKTYLPDFIDAIESADDLKIGDEIIVPAVPEFYARRRQPIVSMWDRLAPLIETGNPEALSTVLRWIPTLTERQFQYQFLSLANYGEILVAVRHRPELWPFVLGTRVDAENVIQSTYSDALRACAGDAVALERLRERLRTSVAWTLSESIAVVALKICEDRSYVDEAITRMTDADFSARWPHREYLEVVADSGDLVALKAAVADARAKQKPEELHARQQALWRIHDLERIILHIKLRDLMTTALN